MEHIQAQTTEQFCKLAGLYVKFYIRYLNLPCVEHIQVQTKGQDCKLAEVYVPFPFVCLIKLVIQG